MFSQTGSEIAALAKHLRRWPDVIVTNNSNKDKWCKELQELDNPRVTVKVVTATQAKTANFLHNIEGSKASLVTLHGWLRIIPADICEQYNIVNGHPGLINTFPELKGKDPQVKAYELNHSTIGSVVHKVTAEVDDGEILEWSATFLEEDAMLENTYARLKHTSFSAWVKFFKKQ